MFFVPRRQIWTQQPQTEAAVAAEYLSLNPKLIVNYGASPNDLGSSKFPVAVNSAYGVDAQGKGLKGSSGVAQYAARLTGKELTIVISVTPGDYAGSSQMLLETEVATAARTEGSLMLLPYYNTAGANASLWNLFLYPSDGINYTYGSVVFPAPTAGIPHTLAIRINRNLTGAAKILSIHVDGVAQVLTPRLDSASNTQNSNSNFNTNNIYINQRAGALLPGAHNVHFVGVFGSLFSSEKAKSLSENPWQIFKRPDSRIFVPVSVGGGTTTVTSDSAASYKVQGSVQSSAAASYGIRTAVSNDASATYNILSATSVSASTSAGYSIRGSINQGTTASYSLRGSVTQDTSATYSILSASVVSSSVTAGYAIKGSVQSSIVAGYSIAQAVQAEIAASYIIRSGVVSEAQAVYVIRGLVQQSIAANYAIDGTAFTGSISDADITRIVQAVLAAINATTIPVDTRKMNGAPIIGTGLVGDDWRGVGVQPQ